MSDLLVNSAAANRQNQASVGVASDGSYVVTWVSYTADLTGSAIHAQRFSASGMPQGPEIAVSDVVTFIDTITARPKADVAVAPDGSFVVAWREGGDVLVRRYDAAGLPLGDTLTVTTQAVSSFGEPVVAIDASGGFIVSWGADTGTGSVMIQAQRFDAAGAVGGVQTVSAGRHPSIAVDATGGYVVAWNSFTYASDGDLWGVYAQRFNALGEAQGEAFLVNTTTATLQQAPAVAMDAAGNFVIVWESGNYGDGIDGFRFGIYAQRYTASGAPIGGEFRVNSTSFGDQGNPSVAMDAVGDFVVTWASEGQDGSLLGVYAQRFSAGGVPQGPEFRVNLDALGHQNRPAVAMGPDGRFTVVWDSGGGFGDLRFAGAQVELGGDGSDSGVFVRSFLPDGRSVPALVLDLDSSVAGAGRAIDFVPGAAPQAVLDERIAIVAQGLPLLSGATARLEARPDGAAQETLLLDAEAMAFAAAAGISVAWNGTTGELNLSGSASAEAYETVLQGLSYANSAAAPSGADRVVAVQLTAPGGLQSKVAHATLSAWTGTPGLTLDLDAARAGNGSQATALTSEGPARAFGAEVSIGALGVATLTGATVALGGRQAGSVEALGLTAEASAAATAAGITASWDATAGILTLSGSASASAYEAALEGVRYADSALASGGTRTLSVEITGPGGVGATATGTLAVHRTAGTDVPLAVSGFRELSRPDIAFDAAGNLLVVWDSNGQDGSGLGVFAQRVSPAGAPLSPIFQVNSNTTGNQSDPAMAVAPDGSFVVAWVSVGQDGDAGGIYAQRFSAAGAPLGAEFLVNNLTAGTQIQPAIAMDGLGRFTIAWTSSPPDITLADVYARRFDAAGKPLGDQFVIGTVTADIQQAPAIAMNVDGDTIVTWTSRAAGISQFNVHAQRYDAAGAPLGGEFVVNTTLAGSQSQQAVGIDAAGGFVIAWSSNQTVDSNIYAQRYDANGSPLGGEFLVNTFLPGNQTEPVIAMRPDGSFVVAWRSNGQDGQGTEIYARQYSASGLAQGGEFRLNGITPGNQGQPDLALAQDGGFAAVWGIAGSNDASLFAGFFDIGGESKLIDLDLSAPGTGFRNTFFADGAAIRIADADATINNLVGLGRPSAIEDVNAYITSLTGLGFTSATATLSGRSDGMAEFLFLDGAASGVVADWDEASATLTLNGPGTIAEFLAALQAIRYVNTDATPTMGDRAVAVRFFGAPVATNTVTATITMASANSAPTGTVGLGHAAGALVADTTLLADADGLGAITFAWQSSRDGGASWTDIPGAASPTFTPGNAQAGLLLRVEVRYTDDGGTAEAVASADVARVGTAGRDMLATDGTTTILLGLGGADRLTSTRADDTLVGGTGNDVYVVDDAGDVVVEVAGGGNADLVRASSDHTLAEHVERLVLLGKADLVGTGNALGNILNGNAGANLLNGLDGNDRLNGRGGVDTMAGGTGNDVYVVDDVRDVLVEDADQGIDRVASVVDWTLGAAFERLTLLGTADINGTGNELANAIRGNDGANSLFGGAGRDWLDGRLGADTLAGGADNDIMFVDDLDDVVIEEADGGMDRVVSSVDWTLGEHVEQLVLRGSADLSGTGNALGNLMVGNAGANRMDGGVGNDRLDGLAGDDVLLGGAGKDRLNGGVGADTLTGGADADLFDFRAAAEADGDVVTDFDAVQGDRISLRAIDADTTLAGDQAFSWIGTAAFGGVAGQLRFAGGVLQGDVNGDRVADFAMTLDGVTSLSRADVFL